MKNERDGERGGGLGMDSEADRQTERVNGKEKEKEGTKKEIRPYVIDVTLYMNYLNHRWNN